MLVSMTTLLRSPASLYTVPFCCTHDQDAPPTRSGKKIRHRDRLRRSEGQRARARENRGWKAELDQDEDEAAAELEEMLVEEQAEALRWKEDEYYSNYRYNDDLSDWLDSLYDEHNSDENLLMRDYEDAYDSDFGRFRPMRDYEDWS